MPDVAMTHDEIGWLRGRAEAVGGLLQREDYRGWDPFDLTNSRLLRVPEDWARTQLVASKVGARLVPAWARRALLVPVIEDPKTYVCAYFGYRALGDVGRARELADRLAALAAPAWGYDFAWGTRTSGVNRRRASTLVPGSFAVFALADDTVVSGPRHASVLMKAIEHYATRHHTTSPEGEFLAYFAEGKVNTHNANLLGCAALSIAARVFERPDWEQLAARCAETTLARVDERGYLRYAEHPSGEWTDCFHHLYVMACVLALRQTNPALGSTDDVLERMRSYFRQAFLRDDGLINYYPGRLYPVDPHNYAAAAIYAMVFGTDEDLPRGRAPELLAAVDDQMWDPARGRYLFRRHPRRVDRRAFLRWTQAWMFAALAITAAGGIPGYVDLGAPSPEGTHARMD